VRQKESSDSITSYDVVHWLIEQTCAGIEQLQPLYFPQGADFCRRTQAALDDADFLVDEEQRESYLATLRQYEQQKLEALYGVNPKSKSSASNTSKFSGSSYLQQGAPCPTKRLPGCRTCCPWFRSARGKTRERGCL